MTALTCLYFSISTVVAGFIILGLYTIWINLIISNKCMEFHHQLIESIGNKQAYEKIAEEWASYKRVNLP